MTPEGLARTHRAAFGAAAWDQATFAGYLVKPFHQIVGEDACFIVLSVVADEAEILTLATHPDEQRKGRAAALLVEVSDLLSQQGVGRMFLDVASDNTAALALYRAAGFSPFATRRNYYANGADAICMNIELTPA